MINSIYIQKEKNGNYVFTLDFLGFEAKDVTAEIDEYNTLVVSAKKDDKEKKRQINLQTLAKIADLDKINAEAYGGLVTVVIPPKKEARKKIKIL